MQTNEQTPAAKALIEAAAQAQEAFTADELEQFAKEKQALDSAPLCFAVPGTHGIIESVCPKTRRGHHSGEALHEVRARYPGAVLMTMTAWRTDRAQAQDAPGTWEPITEERYWELLNVLPPAAQKRGGFLVGEASDHHAGTGRPRFTCCREKAGEFAEYSRPMSHAEFVAAFGACGLYYS